jgi:predicted AlkP superfamily phosphohydrolase/phosphomutase
MPVVQYQRFWRKMPAFALPSFYDGRLRINLRGRERSGIVPPEFYRDTCDRLVSILNGCVDPATGQRVIENVELANHDDPRELGSTEADIVITWRDSPSGLEHPDFGRIGPVPYRRTGGHTGKYGFALVHGSGIGSGSYGARSSYDVVPTLINLLGEPKMNQLSGTSLLEDISPVVATTEGRGPFG